MPPIVHPKEVDKLKDLLVEVAEGKRFVLQGGDCAERFEDCRLESIESKLKIILQMSLVLIWGAGVSLVRIGRIAGQYSKPRSANTEDTPNGKILCYKGDSINGYDKEDRAHDPQRLVQAYFHSAATWNYVRSLATSGFADLHHPETWDLGFIPAATEKREQYETIRSDIMQAMKFMDTCGMKNPEQTGVDFYSSHEGLVLDYETAMTHECNGQYYNTGAHMLWIGDRTRAVTDAHVEYFRGISNPIGVKVGPTMKLDELVELISILNPDKEPGRLILITRFGSKKVKDLLPPIIRAVQDAGFTKVVWQCDPMHGNTTTSASGHKTRAFDSVLEELLETFRVHRELGSWLGGVHFEMTGEDVTECTGGALNISSEELSRNYQSYCDPRLNYTQSLEMAFQITRHLLKAREPMTPTRGL